MMVVADVADVFVPMVDGFLVSVKEARSMMERLGGGGGVSVRGGCRWDCHTGTALVYSTCILLWSIDFNIQCIYVYTCECVGVGVLIHIMVS